MTYWNFYAAETSLVESIKEFANDPNTYTRHAVQEERKNIHISFGELVSFTVNNPDLDTATQASIISSVYIKADEERVELLSNLVPEGEYQELKEDWIDLSVSLEEWIEDCKKEGKEKEVAKELARAFSKNLLNDLLHLAQGLQLEDLEG